MLIGARSRAFPHVDIYGAQVYALILMLHCKSYRLPTGFLGSIADLKGSFARDGFPKISGGWQNRGSAKTFRHEHFANGISGFLNGAMCMHNQIHQFNEVREYYRMLKGIGEMAMAFSITWMLERDWSTLLVGINFGLKPKN